MSIKAIIIIPPLRDFYMTYHRFSCIGAHIVKQIVCKQVISTKILNFPLIKKKSILLELPDCFHYLKPYIIPHETGRFSFFTQFKHFGPEFRECAKIVRAEKPDLVLYSCFAFCYADQTINLAKVIKQQMPDCYQIAGGAGVSVFPEYFLQSGFFDFLVCGEAEVSLPEFIRIFKDNFNNRTRRLSVTLEFSQLENIMTCNTQNPQTCISDYCAEKSAKKQTEGIDIDIAIIKTLEKKDSLHFATSLSRGCQNNCQFCSISFCHGNGFRKVLSEKFKLGMEEIQIQNEQNNKKIILNFEDDNLLNDKNYLRQIIEYCRMKFKDIEIFFENGLDYRLLTNDLLQFLIANKTGKFNFSLASIDTNILHKQKRKFNLLKYEKWVKIINTAYNLPVITYFICGFKEDNPEIIVRTLAYLSVLPTQIGLSFFYPVPGMPGYENKERFLSIPSNLCAGMSAYPWSKSLSTKTLVTVFRLVRYINAYKQITKYSQDWEIINRIKKEQKLFTYVKVRNRKEIRLVENQDNELVQLYFKELQKYK